MRTMLSLLLGLLLSLSVQDSHGPTRSPGHGNFGYKRIKSQCLLTFAVPRTQNDSGSGELSDIYLQQVTYQVFNDVLARQHADP